MTHQSSHVTKRRGALIARVKARRDTWRNATMAGLLLLGLALPSFTPVAEAYETVAVVTAVLMRDDQSSPVIGYWTPTYLDKTATDISYWIIIAERQRATGAVKLMVNFEMLHREEHLRKITTTTLEDGDPLPHGPISENQPCDPECHYVENVGIEISPATLKGLAGEPLKIRIETAQGWSKVIEFPGDIITSLIEKTGI